MQQILFNDLFKSALHVSGDELAHPQEHFLTVYTVFGISRRMRWAGHVERMGEEKGVYKVLLGKPEEGDHWGDLGVDGWIIIGWISRRWEVGIWTGLGWPRIETGGGRL